MCINSSAHRLIANSFHDIQSLFLLLPALGLPLQPRFAPDTRQRDQRPGSRGSLSMVEGRRGSIFPPVGWPRTQLQLQISIPAALSSASPREEAFSLASMDRSHLPTGQEVEGAMSHGVQLLQPTSHPSGQLRAQAKLPGRSSLGCAPGRRGVWGNVAQGHL